MGEYLRRPTKPTKQLDISTATDAEALRHCNMMLSYWIAEAKWQEARVAELLAIRTKRHDPLEGIEPRGRCPTTYVTRKGAKVRCVMLDGHMGKHDYELPDQPTGVNGDV